jgi:hypothetical protein
MFTSKEHLSFNLGVDEDIARFFVDRKVPEKNRYWQGRYLYVAGGTGYLFIPLFFDLQYKCGVPRELVLNEHYVKIAEDILHSAALLEFREITFKDHLNHCKEIMASQVKNMGLFNDLLMYFNDEQLTSYKNLGTGNKALNRADTFLLSLSFLDLTTETTDTILKCWYALVPSFLLMDDVADLQKDKENEEENFILENGGGREGVQKSIEFLHEKFNWLKSYNSKLGSYFERSLEKKIQSDYIQSMLNTE